jgi:protein-disulfide isomerase
MSATGSPDGAGGAGAVREPALADPVGPDDHAQGPPHAPVTLVVYGDYECPFTRRARTVVRAAQQRAGDRLRYVFRNLPLAKHPHAFRAAEAAEAAAAQGKFWEMYELLFRTQWALEEDDVVGYATLLGLNLDRFRDDLARHAHAPRIRTDLESGQRSGVRGTPTFFVNGTRYEDLEDSLDALLGVIDRAAAQPASPSATQSHGGEPGGEPSQQPSGG